MPETPDTPSPAPRRRRTPGTAPSDRLAPWFADAGRTAFAFQRETWAAYARGESGLVHAPTGCGKTLAAWGGPVAEALERADEGGGLRVLWLTPLRALALDTAQALAQSAAAVGLPWRVELRTGDVSATIKARQRERMPEALVTTPESLSVLLSHAGAAARLGSMRAIVVDEWHELMGSKRGVQAELCLTHLRATAPSVRTWGLSATIGNLDEAMRTLLGPRGGAAGRLVRGAIDKAVEIETLLPARIDRFPWSGHLGLEQLPRVVERIAAARSTLVFTNTRAQAEIWFAKILAARPDWAETLGLHHGSIERDERRAVERGLADGALRAVVCTSSLDLGVDFAPVEQAIQIGSPKGIARLLQRAGRSGHRPGATSRLVGVPTNAMEIVEYAAGRDALAARRVEPRRPPSGCLDVLVQHLVTLAAGDGVAPDAARDAVRDTAAFAALSDDAWRWCLDFVRRGGPTLEAYPQYARVVEDDGRLVVSSRPLAQRHRLTIGTITSDAAVQVRFEHGRRLGSVEESFVARLVPGDVFVFAGRRLVLVRLRDMTAVVRPARRGRGTVPRWQGGRSPLSTELADAVLARLDAARAGMFDGPEMALVRPLLELQAQWSRLPGRDDLLVEHLADRAGHHHFVFTLAGRLANEGLAALVAHRAGRRRPCTMEVTGNDWGIELLADRDLELDETAWRELLSPAALVDDLLACVASSTLARRRFRDIARIAGLVFTGFPGERRPARHLQASSELFFDVFRQFDPANLLLDQAHREVLDQELEVGRLRSVLESLAQRRLVLVRTDRLTPLAFPLWAERIRAQSLSTESWSARVARMAVQLEAAADAPGRRRRRGRGAAADDAPAPAIAVGPERTPPARSPRYTRRP